MIPLKDSQAIARALDKVGREHTARFILRASDGRDKTCSANSAGSQEGEIICPAQRQENTSCSSCTLCFSSPQIPIGFEGHARALRADHPALVNATTLFSRTQIKHVSEVKKVLQPGNGKIGKKIVGKFWKGARVLCLTLTERETCPRSCHHWATCYGNNMHQANRLKVDGLMEALELELSRLNPEQTYAIRLHILGDFWSVEYVEFWARMLETHSNIRIFGFTAHPIDNSHLEGLRMNGLLAMLGDVGLENAA